MVEEIIGIVTDDGKEIDLTRTDKVYAEIREDEIQPGYLVFASTTLLEETFGYSDPTKAVGQYVFEMYREPRPGHHVYRVLPRGLLGIRKPRSTYDRDDRVTEYTGRTVAELIRKGNQD